MSEDKQQNPQQTAERPIVILTPAAIEKVKSMMSREGKEGYGIRFGAITGGCAGFSYDMRFQKKSYDNDQVVEQDGVKLFINEESVPFIKGTEIDYVDTLNESGFQYKNPNATSSCGCGTSFS